jgi:hypothetical protein
MVLAHNGTLAAKIKISIAGETALYPNAAFSPLGHAINFQLSLRCPQAPENQAEQSTYYQSCPMYPLNLYSLRFIHLMFVI